MTGKIQIPTNTMEQEFAVHERRGYRKGLNVIASYVTEMEAQLKATKKDAERYQWLRSRMPGSAYRVAGIIYSEGGEGVDAGIDAAIAKEPT